MQNIQPLHGTFVRLGMSEQSASYLVSPANVLPRLASDHGATVIEINLEPTPLSNTVDFFLRGPSGEVLPGLVAKDPPP